MYVLSLARAPYISHASFSLPDDRKKPQSDRCSPLSSPTTRYQESKQHIILFSSAIFSQSLSWPTQMFFIIEHRIIPNVQNSDRIDNREIYIY